MHMEIKTQMNSRLVGLSFLILILLNQISTAQDNVDPLTAMYLPTIDVSARLTQVYDVPGEDPGGTIEVRWEAKNADAVIIKQINMPDSERIRFDSIGTFTAEGGGNYTVTAVNQAGTSTIFCSLGIQWKSGAGITGRIISASVTKTLTMGYATPVYKSKSWVSSCDRKTIIEKIRRELRKLDYDIRPVYNDESLCAIYETTPEFGRPHPKLCYGNGCKTPFEDRTIQHQIGFQVVITAIHCEKTQQCEVLLLPLIYKKDNAVDGKWKATQDIQNIGASICESILNNIN